MTDFTDEQKKRLLQVAEDVENSSTFNMAWAFWGWFGAPPFHKCGTAACIMGHAEARRVAEEGVAADQLRDNVSWSLAQTYLGLTDGEANRLFCPTRDGVCPVDYQSDNISGKRAARTIRRLVEDRKAGVRW